MTEFVKATTKQHFQAISNLASIIWHEHYIPIIGEEQVIYMLKNLQSSQVMYSQFQNGYVYFMVMHKAQLVGYISIKQQQDNLFLSKIYISKDFRGQKIGKKAILFIEEKGREMGCKSIKLDVNKFNKNTIAAYETFGFKKIGEIIFSK